MDHRRDDAWPRGRAEPQPRGPRLAAFVLLTPLLLTAGGCVPLAAAWANITGGDIIEPEFRLTKGPLLVLIEDRKGQVTEPRAIRELHKTLSENFLAFGVNEHLVPPEDVERLGRTDRNYARLSIRQIGEKLGAEQVLYLEVERFTLEAEPGAPLFKGEFIIRVKVLATHAERDVRLWPREPSGRRIAVTTVPVSSEGDKSSSDVAQELAIKMGQSVARLFYQHRKLDE